MTFTVKYRTNSGSVAEKDVEAANRTDCFAKCKALGIVPIGVEARAVVKKPAQPSGFVASGRARLILPVAALAAIGAMIWIIFHDSTPSKSTNYKKARSVGSVAKVTPAKAAKPQKGVVKLKPKTREERLSWFEKRYGTNIPENLKSTVYFLKNPPQQTFRPKSRREDVFKHHSEKTLAAILLHTPGTFMIQRSVYDDRFDRDFIKSLEEPIISEDSDDEETKELKNAVNEVKAEMAERMRAGEKPSDIINEIMNTAYELGKYSRNVEDMVREIVDDPTKTDEDVEEFVNAANKLLKEKGAKEMEMPNLFRRQIRLKMLARKASQQDSTQQGENKE